MAGERGDRPNIITQPERGRIVADTTKIRTTFTPGEVIEVSSTELLDLERQGLIHSREGDEAWTDAEPVDIESGVVTDGLAEQATTGDAPKVVDDEAPASIDDKTEAPAKVKTKGA